MHKRTLLLTLLIGCAHSSSGPGTDKSSVPSAKDIETKRVDAADTLHGVVVPDPYRWLEDPKKVDVQAWMTAQDGVTRKFLGDLSGREELAARLKQLYYVDEIGTPYKRGGRYFIWKRPADAEKGIMYFKDSLDAKEQVLIDPNELSKGEGGPVSLGSVTPTWDGKKVAYALRPNNADEAILYVMDVDTRKTSEIDVIEGAKYADPAWTADGSGFYYTWLPVDPKIPVADRPGYAEVRFHRLGTKASEDIVVHERLNDPKTFIDAQLSKNGRWLFLTVWHGWSENELYVKEMPGNGEPGKDFDPKSGWNSISQDRKARFKIKAHEDQFYIATNDEASHWKVVRVDPAKLERSNWVTVLKEDPKAVLKNATIVGGHLGATYMKNATSELRLYTLKGDFVRNIELPVLGSASSIVGNADDDEAFFSFSSFVYPRETYRTLIKSGETKVFSKSNVQVDSAAFDVKQVWYDSKDGTKVSMFIVHKKGLKLTGDNATLLYGYGGFNISLTPRFRATTYAWLEKGGVYAMPNLRGGGEYGEAWHKAGMLLNKQNVFDDYIAAAEYLIKEKYTSSAKLAISGRSNGGLLVGAAMTQRPDLYRAVICGVPLLDMVRYHLFGSGKTWIPEYGSADDAEQFKAIHAYSPYNKVVDGVAYPSLLMLATDADDRVDPMHARKFVAAVAHASSASSGDAPILLRIEKNAGHGGADAKAASVKEGVDWISYLLEMLK